MKLLADTLIRELPKTEIHLHLDVSLLVICTFGLPLPFARMPGLRLPDTYSGPLPPSPVRGCLN